MVACVLERGEFTYKLIENIEQLPLIQGSKYIKSNPKDCYSIVVEKLKDKKKTLFIGLPCHVAAIKNYVGEKLIETLYTIDLICHGTPSPIIFQNYLTNKNIQLKEINNISFREKSRFSLKVEQKDIEADGLPDKYTIAFMESLCYTENCYQCNYAKLLRGADVTLGDSWGTELTEEEKKGISLVLCQTQKGKEILQYADCWLYDVDLEKAIYFNQQLKNPSRKPKCYNQFFEAMEKKGLSYAVKKYRKKICIKQNIKRFAIRLHLLKKN